MVSVVSVHQWHHHRDDINVLVNLKDTVLVPIPKTVETEGVAQPDTWQSRTLVVGLLGSVVLFEGQSVRGSRWQPIGTRPSADASTVEQPTSLQAQGGLVTSTLCRLL